MTTVSSLYGFQTSRKRKAHEISSSASSGSTISSPAVSGFHEKDGERYPVVTPLVIMNWSEKTAETIDASPYIYASRGRNWKSLFSAFQCTMKDIDETDRMNPQLTGFRDESFVWSREYKPEFQRQNMTSIVNLCKDFVELWNIYMSLVGTYFVNTFQNIVVLEVFFPRLLENPYCEGSGHYGDPQLVPCLLNNVVVYSNQHIYSNKASSTGCVAFIPGLTWTVEQDEGASAAEGYMCGDVVSIAKPGEQQKTRVVVIAWVFLSVDGDNQNFWEVDNGEGHPRGNFILTVDLEKLPNLHGSSFLLFDMTKEEIVKKLFADMKIFSLHVSTHFFFFGLLNGFVL